MGKIGILIATICCTAACGTDPPSCQQAMTHFYEVAHCTFIDTSTNPPSQTTEAQALNACTSINVQIPERCRGKFDDWKNCLNEATSTTCADCSQEQDALFACD